MSAEAFARLRFEVETALDTFGEKHPALNNTLLRVSPNDLRALLDAHAALEAAHVEALDALERFVPLTKGMGFGGMDSTFDRENARTVLAKAGR